MSALTPTKGINRAYIDLVENEILAQFTVPIFFNLPFFNCVKVDICRLHYSKATPLIKSNNK